MGRVNSSPFKSFRERSNGKGCRGIQRDGRCGDILASHVAFAIIGGRSRRADGDPAWAAGSRKKWNWRTSGPYAHSGAIHCTGQGLAGDRCGVRAGNGGSGLALAGMLAAVICVSGEVRETDTYAETTHDYAEAVPCSSHD